MPILWPLKVTERGNGKTQRKTLEIEHSCLFIHHTIWIYPFPHLILFDTPKKSLLKLSYPSQIFVPKKIPESKISNPKKSFDHPRHLKSRVPPLGWRYIWYYTESTTEHSRPTPLQDGLFESKDLLPLGGSTPLHLPYRQRMCCPNGYGFCAFLFWKRVKTFAHFCLN